MRKNRFLMLIVVLFVSAALVTACSSPTPTATSLPLQATSTSKPEPTATTAPTAAPTSTVQTSATAEVPATGSTQQAGTITSLDPCQLITSDEASKLTGVTYGAGLEGTVPGGMKTCTYSLGSNIFTVNVIQAADEATAKAAQDQFLNDLKSNLQQLTSEGMTVTDVPNFADAAISAKVDVTANGIALSGAAFAFRKGTIFFGFSDIALGGKAPTPEAMQAQASTVLGLLP